MLTSKEDPLKIENLAEQQTRESQHMHKEIQTKCTNTYVQIVNTKDFADNTCTNHIVMPMKWFIQLYHILDRILSNEVPKGFEVFIYTFMQVFSFKSIERKSKC